MIRPLILKLKKKMHYLTVLNYKNYREIRELLKNQNDSEM